jgi:hypothetical protein
MIIRFFYLAFFLFFSLSAVAKLLPAEDELSSTNTHCNYEKYKNGHPDMCPRINLIEYGITIYDDEIIQGKMQAYLVQQLDLYKASSKHSPVELKKYNSFRLSKQTPFNHYYENLIPNDKTLSLQFGVRVFKDENRTTMYSTIIFVSTKSVHVASDVSQPLELGAEEEYLKGMVDKHLEYIFSPQIFRDAALKKDVKKM